MTGTRASGPKRRQRSGIERPSLRYPMTERGTRGRPGRQWPEAMADRENPTTPWDRPFAGWQETMSAHEIKRMQRHIERLQAAMGPHSTHSPQRPHERTSSEPAQGPHLVEIAGPDGSGKTTVMRRTVDLSWFPGARGVDADALAAALPGGFVKPGTRRARHLPPDVTVTTPGRSARIFSGKPCWRRTEMRFVRAARHAGYCPHPVFVAPRDPAVNADRVARRYVEDGSHSRGTWSIAISGRWTTCRERLRTSISRIFWTIRRTAACRHCNA